MLSPNHEDHELRRALAGATAGIRPACEPGTTADTLDSVPTG